MMICWINKKTVIVIGITSLVSALWLFRANQNDGRFSKNDEINIQSKLDFRLFSEASFMSLAEHFELIDDPIKEHEKVDFF